LLRLGRKTLLEPALEHFGGAFRALIDRAADAGKWVLGSASRRSHSAEPVQNSFINDSAIPNAFLLSPAYIAPTETIQEEEDMFRLCRRSASAFIVLVTLVAVQAQAGNSYLFRATDEEIDTVMSHYFPKGYDREAARQQLTAPFDCRNYGDLCREVGEESAYQMLRTVWEEAKRQTPADMIARGAEQQLGDLELRWFERLYPDGVDGRDSYWGVLAAAGGTPPCVDTVSAESSDGEFRIVHKSRRHVILLVAYGRIRLEHFRRNIFGNYRTAKADRLQTQGLVIVDKVVADPVGLPVSETKDDTRQVDAQRSTFAESPDVIPYVDGCGSSVGSGIGTVCSCSGELPFGFPLEP
jgi:hypothetical protein